ncbi:MAG TPA: hypothetical protein VEW74_08315 [Candidatus Nitrosotalea sp.]|nr:hypothetical protein [Candidatus Nitrosotalea sp.]
MPLLRMRDATFDNGSARAGPISLDLECGERAALTGSSAQTASIVALLAAGIVKATSGCVLVGDYDPTVQSVACKRIAAFVPHEPFPLDEGEFARYIEYRAALWNVERGQARTRAALLRKRLTGMHEAFAYPLIGALIAMPKLLVLDRPQPGYAPRILDVTAGIALFSTHVEAAAAAAFAPGALAQIRASQA